LDYEILKYLFPQFGKSKKTIDSKLSPIFLLTCSFNNLSSSSTATITLKASKAFIIIWILRSLLFIGILLLILLTDGSKPFYWFVVFILIILFGYFEVSKDSNLFLTPNYLQGGTFFRCRSEWNKITEVYTSESHIYWEEVSKKGKILQRKSPYNHWGRECLQNGKKVSKDLAIEWINKLRKAESKNERIQLLTDFRQIRSTKERLIRTLPEEEKEIANRLFEEFKNIKGEYRAERRMEIAQYFKQKGWVLPKLEISEERKIIGCLVIVFLFGFLFLIIVKFLGLIF